MRAITLIAACDEYDSEPGLLIKGMPAFDGLMADRDGTSIAHDVLEHQNGIANIGTVWDELEALGGIWQVRGRHGDLMTRSMHSPVVNVASDVTRMFFEWDGLNGPHSMATRAHLYDDDFNEIIEQSRGDIRKEWRDYRDEAFDGEELEQYLALALHRMRTGFRKAERRFGDRFCGYETFRAIKDVVARVHKHEIEWEGQEFVLRYGNCNATIRAAEYDYD